MRILFDQGPGPVWAIPHCTFCPNRREQGWSTLSNGELLRLAEEAGFDLFLTTDKNLRYQQNLSKRKIAIVVLGNGLWPFVRPMLAQVAAAIEVAKPGSYTEVEIPTRKKDRQ